MVIVERCVTDERRMKSGQGPWGRVLPHERRLFYAISAMLPQLRQIWAAGMQSRRVDRAVPPRRKDRRTPRNQAVQGV